MCSLNQYRPKMNTFPLFLVFIPGVILGLPIMTHIYAIKRLKSFRLSKSTSNRQWGQIHAISAERVGRWPMAKQRISSVQADEMYML